MKLSLNAVAALIILLGVVFYVGTHYGANSSRKAAEPSIELVEEVAALKSQEGVESTTPIKIEAENSTVLDLIHVMNRGDSVQEPLEFLNKFIEGENPDFESWEFRREVLKLAKTDWRAANAFIELIPDNGLKNKIIVSALQAIAPDDPDRAVMIAREAANTTLRQKRLGEVCDAIAADNPAYVADLFIANGMKNIGDYKIQDLAADYSRYDPEAAKTFIDGIEDSVLQKTALMQYMYVWGKKDPYAAADYAIGQSSSAGYSGPLWVIGQNLAQKDIDSALEFAMSRPVNENSAELLTGVFIRWAKDDIHSAAEKILEVETGRVRVASFGAVASEFAKVEPDDGIAWLSKINSEHYRRHSTHQFVKQLVSIEPNAAVNYVNQLEQGEIKDYAIYPMITKFREVEPAYAIEWASEISKEGTRNRWINATYRKWKKQYPLEAEAWLKETNLVPDNYKKQLAK